MEYAQKGHGIQNYPHFQFYPYYYKVFLSFWYINSVVFHTFTFFNAYSSYL